MWFRGFGGEAFSPQRHEEHKESQSRFPALRERPDILNAKVPRAPKKGFKLVALALAVGGDGGKLSLWLGSSIFLPARHSGRKTYGLLGGLAFKAFHHKDTKNTKNHKVAFPPSAKGRIF